MEKGTGMLFIAGACLAVLLIGRLRQITELLLNFCIRSVMGAIAICGINSLLAGWGIHCAVGLNLCSFLTSGLFGVSGVSLLYAVAAIRFL